MAVSQPTIKSDLLALYNDARSSPMSEEEFADRMATIIRDAILSADVTGTATGVESGTSTAPVTGDLQ